MWLEPIPGTRGLIPELTVVTVVIVVIAAVVVTVGTAATVGTLGTVGTVGNVITVLTLLTVLTVVTVLTVLPELTALTVLPVLTVLPALTILPVLLVLPVLPAPTDYDGLDLRWTGLGFGGRWAAAGGPLVRDWCGCGVVWCGVCCCTVRREIRAVSLLVVLSETCQQCD